MAGSGKKKKQTFGVRCGQPVSRAVVGYRLYARRADNFRTPTVTTIYWSARALRSTRVLVPLWAAYYAILAPRWMRVIQR